MERDAPLAIVMVDDIRDRVKRAKADSIRLAAVDTLDKDRALEAMACALDAQRSRIMGENALDMDAARSQVESGDMAPVLMKRLAIDDRKIDGMIAGIRDVASLTDPVGETLDALELDEGLELFQISCPIGLIGVIFESRPDVVPQIMSLCLKSGNATVFKGGREALRSNRVLFDTLKEAIADSGLPSEAFQIMETREDVGQILDLDEYIDLLIPRGSNAFVRYIQDNTRIPVLGHASGICHVHVDAAADLDMAVAVVVDSKVQYPAVCNAAETLLVDGAVAEAFLSRVAERLRQQGVELHCDPRSLSIIGGVPATDEDWDAEYNDLVLAIRVVDSLDQGIDHINAHGSHHTDAIITSDRIAAGRFAALVDSASVMVNASTRFADGYRYGKGAEVGISTNKVHSRGPVGMEGLMIYKYVLVGNGQVVADYASGARTFTHRTLDKRYGDQ